METSEHIDTYNKISRHKICVVGMNGTGKKSFISKFNSDLPFHNDPLKVSATKNKKIGDDLYIFNFWNFNNTLLTPIPSGLIRPVELELLTTKEHYTDATVIFIVVDNRPITLDIARLFKKDINAKYDSPEFYEPINPIILLVNKTDLLDEKTKSELNYDDFCTEYGFSRWIPISTKTGEGIDLAYGDMLDICKCFACLQRPSKIPEISNPQEKLLVEPKSEISSPQENLFVDIPIPKIEPELITDTFIKSITMLLQNPFPENDVQFVLTLKRKLLTLYFSPEMDSDRKQIKSDKKLQKVIHDIHYIVVDENITDVIKLTKVLNLVMDYGKSF